jgi:hypothetical protein
MRHGFYIAVVVLACASFVSPVWAYEWMVHQNTPNPFCSDPGSSQYSETMFVVVGLETALIALEIWDPTKTYLVGGSNPEVLDPGMYYMFWDGTDLVGEPVGNGVYPYRLRASRPDGGNPMVSEWVFAEVHCDTPVRRSSWGAIKGLYR